MKTSPNGKRMDPQKGYMLQHVEEKCMLKINGVIIIYNKINSSNN